MQKRMKKCRVGIADISKKKNQLLDMNAYGVHAVSSRLNSTQCSNMCVNSFK